jgi:hypothetical protein
LLSSLGREGNPETGPALHDRLVDRAARYAIKKGWPQRDLDEQFEAWADLQPPPEFPEGLFSKPITYPVAPIPWPSPFMLINGRKVPVQ